MKFSQRMGLTEVEKVIQVGFIDSDLRNTLWSVLTVYYWKTFDKEKYYVSSRTDNISGSNLDNLFISLWIHFFKKPIDTIPHLYFDSGGGLEKLRNYFFNAEWFEVYDFVEFVSNYGPSEVKNRFISSCDNFLEVENSGYRFIDGRITEISSADEIEEVEAAISNSTPYYGVKQHLRTSIQMLSDKTKPDYRNSIKESISAVESLCKTLVDSDKATLGGALKLLEKQGAMHPALKSAFNSLYGYTNDADGIRHALMEESDLTSADARFMLVSCSAFINYVIATTVKSG